MNLIEAQNIATKSRFENVEYTKIFNAVKTLMLETLKNTKEPMTSSAVYAATGSGDINACIYALEQLIKEKLVSDTHEMVDGYISTHFHTAF